MADPVVDGLSVALADVTATARHHAGASARAGRLAPEVVEAIASAGLFKLHLPADLGGLATPLPAALDVIEAVAAADGAAGWAVMIGAGPGYFAGTMPPALAAEVFAPATSVVAGSGQPGTAAPARPGDPDGGWTVSGRWRWCSGAPWATWFTFVAAPSDGTPFALAVPAADVTRHPDTWQVRALAATASWDVSLAEVHVPAGRTFALGVAPTRPERLFLVPFGAFAECTMAAVATGLARRLVEELVALLTTKGTRAGGVVADDPVVHHRLGRLVADTRAARAYLGEAVARLWAAPADPAAGLEVALASTHAVATGARAAAEAADLAGMATLPVDDTLGRVVADLQAVGHNAVVASARFGEAGARLLRPGPGPG